MLIKALSDRYDRVVADDPAALPKPGWCIGNLSGYIEIAVDGSFLRISPITDDKGKVAPRPVLMPLHATRTRAKKPYFLCDTVGYLMGLDADGAPSEREKFGLSRDLHRRILSDTDSVAARAVLSWFDRWNPDKVPDGALDGTGLPAGAYLAFAVNSAGREVSLLDDADSARAWDASNVSDYAAGGARLRCMVTGDIAPVLKSFPQVKGMGGSGGSASLVSFHNSADCSYGHDKGDLKSVNAPISATVAEKSVAALNALVADPVHRRRVGNMTVVYWGDSPREREASSLLGNLCFGVQGNLRKIEREAATRQLDADVGRLISGRLSDGSAYDFDAPFYICGLEVGGKRISVRFVEVESFGDAADHADAFHRDISISSGASSDHASFPRELLASIAPPSSTKSATLPPSLYPRFVEAVLRGNPYPYELLQLSIARIRAGRDDAEKRTRKMTRPQASLIKAVLIRNYRKDIRMELDEDNVSQPYLLGRCFAVLESLQFRANGSTNISNRYMNAASEHPATVFPTLLKLAGAHLEKLSHDGNSSDIWYKQRIGELLSASGEATFPARFTLPEQGEFLLGYYQQWANDRKQKRLRRETATAQKEE